MENKLLTIKDIRHRLNCAPSTLYRWIAIEHFPPPIRLGGMARWEEADVDAFLEKAKMRRTEKFGVKPEGPRRPGRPSVRSMPIKPVYLKKK